tara:strand:- start:3888 stop:5183 length:1296 start_codon:yes stop_codon:yes gene_type:complete
MKKIFQNLAILIYVFLTNLFFIFGYVYMTIRRAQSKETQKSFKQKLAQNFSSITDTDKKIIWIHAASIGETYSGLSVAKIILKHNTEICILFTTATLSSAKILKDNANQRIIHQFLPLDVKIFVKRFLNHWSPVLSIFMESEIWPNYYLELDRRRIPLYLLNARLSEKSFRRWNKLKILADRIFSIPKLISCQDNDTHKRYKQLGQSNIRLSENIKYANTPLRTNKKEYEYLKNILEKKFIYIAASVHEKETELFYNLHKKIQEKYPNTVCIFAPRHTETCNKMISLFDAHDDSWSYLPNYELKPDHNLLIVNEVGILGTYFELSKIAVIGGSFDKIGGHNPIEAIQKNCIVLHGENTQNFSDIYESLDKLKCSFLANDANLIMQKIEDFIVQPNKTTDILENINTIISKKKVVVENEIIDILNSELGEIQ